LTHCLIRWSGKNPPTKIFLFGSRSKGTARNDSDYDLVVVCKTTKDSKWASYDKARHFIFTNFGVLADVWVYSEQDFEDWKNEFGSIPETGRIHNRYSAKGTA
jgi:predicted nucleotidyltransferase